jgi:hypothetical protein
MPAVPHIGTRETLPRPSSAPPKLIPSKPSPPFTAYLPASTGRYPASKPRRVLRRSQRDRNRHFSHTPGPSVASAPHAHLSPLRHPFNLRPMLITSRQRSLAFGKVRGAKNAALPGYHRFRETSRVSFRAAPAHSSVLRGCPALLSYPSSPFRARPVPYPVPHGPGLMVSARVNRNRGGHELRCFSVVLGRPVPRPSARHGPESFRFPLPRLSFSPGQAELHSAQRRSD